MKFKVCAKQPQSGVKSPLWLVLLIPGKCVLQAESGIRSHFLPFNRQGKMLA